ncbi:polysaccharide lyase family protein [Alloacidobacterium sp.]|uniref:glycoside hydrolase family 38 N-terminal domain-containing protein n=1 Tax=Alloacidobacterium sp. TaxID=2951999 RepID=UPI002D314AA5|nr:polysaccharide lyase family protein [Alloacidobacterium sp.]HYK36609.1 polysaccharide lyase family protein [Alloacidobacterium sp.]
MPFKSAGQFLFILVAFCLGDHAQAQTEVWRIGTFDRSSAEFADGAPQKPVTFAIGKDQANKDWYGYAPALFFSGHPDASSAPRAIQFSLPATPSPAYRLRVSLLIEHSSMPALRVSINGISGTFYLHPKLDYSMGDTMAAFFPAYAHTTVEFDFPRSYLRRGMNSIALQAIATADKGVPDAGFNYDAVELDRLPALSGGPTAQAEPTIFYQQHGAALTEQVDVFVRSGERLRSGQVDVEIAGQHYKQTLHADQDFGEERVQLAVPEFPADTQARLMLNLNGHATHFTQTIQPQKKWTLYLVPHVHLDVGYTDYQAKVATIQSRILDEAMDLTAKHPSFRFSTDGSWNLEQYLKSRTPQEQQRVIQAIQNEQLYIPAQYANVLTGFPTAETLIRSLYPSADFSRVHHTPLNYANITDVPSYSWSYASVLAAAGIQYFLAGSNNDRAPVLLQGHLNENSPMYWEGPDGKKVLFWYSRHYMQMQFLFGLPPLPETGEEILPLFLQMYQHPGYRASAAIIFGTQVENTDLFPQQAELANKWNALYAYPRIQYSGFHDALADIAKQFGDGIPTVRGDGGPYWEDGIGSDAFYAALERENESRGPSAEKLATISSLVNPRLAVDHDALDAMWKNMVLMDEHTWLSYNSVSDPTSREATEQLRVKDSRATTAADLRDHLLRGSMASLADSIAAGVGSLIVFNPLNWDRDGVVSIDLDKDQEIVDRATDQPVPYSVVHEGNDFRRVEFVAKDVPQVGYKVYYFRRAEKSPSADETSSSTTLESPYYRVELDPSSGAVRSIYDKQLKKELVDENSPYRFGQYLYVTGGDKEPNSLLQYRVVSPKPELQIHGAAQGRLIGVERTAYGWRARLESSAENTPKIVNEIRLFKSEKKIEFVEDVTKKEALTKEAVYFAFPFAMSHPQFQYEIQNGVVDPSKDMYPGAGHEWFSVQHWVSVQQDGVSVTVMPLDTPLVTLGDINRGAWPMEFGQRSGSIFAYAMNNYWHTNYRAAQGDDFRFRFVVTSAPSTDAAALSRMGWEGITPLEADEITSQDKALDLPRPLDGKTSSFLTINDPNVLLDTWKPAEDGDGTILRLIDLGGDARTVTIRTPLLAIRKAVETDAVERDQKQLSTQGANSFQVDIHPHEIVTVRLSGDSVLHAPTE